MAHVIRRVQKRARALSLSCLLSRQHMSLSLSLRLTSIHASLAFSAQFAGVADLELPLLSADDQVNGKPIARRRLGDAVADGTINNETLGYFIGRIFQFLVSIGCDVSRLRFRQHMGNEMAHYATDCWDAELQTSFGWVECVGCADRSAFDLTQHGNATKTVIEASIPLKEPIEKKVIEVVPNKKKMGPKYRKAAGAVMAHLASLSEAEVVAIESALADGGDAVAKITVDGTECVPLAHCVLGCRQSAAFQSCGSLISFGVAVLNVWQGKVRGLCIHMVCGGGVSRYELDSTVVKVERKTVTVHERKFTPSVVEPSFGIGRCIFCVLEHVYAVREGDENRGYGHPHESGASLLDISASDSWDMGLC